MSSFALLKANYGYSPIISLYDAINHATAERRMETEAATRIQAYRRMLVERRAFRAVVRAVLAVQRVYKGYLARKVALRKKIDLEKGRRARVYDYFATLIQSHFRGYWSRKTQYDFYSKRRYIAGIVKKSEEIRGAADASLQDQLVYLEEQRHQQAVKEYEAQLAGKHHLLSTATISGIFKPPLSLEGTKTVFGTTVEDDLKRLQQADGAATASSRKFKPDLPTTQKHTETGPNTNPDSSSTATHNTTSRYWNKGPLDVKPPPSIQASVSYDRMLEAQRYEDSLNKAISEKMHKKQFVVRKPDEPIVKKTIQCETPYQPPRTLRGGRRR